MPDVPEDTETARGKRGALSFLPKINIGMTRPASQSLTTPTSAGAMQTPRTMSLQQILCEVVGICAFANSNLILKIWDDDNMETAFRSSQADCTFKHACLTFLQDSERDRDLEVRHFEVLHDDYTMFLSVLGDKTLVFFVKGHNDTGLPLVDTLHAAITIYLNAMRPDPPSGGPPRGHTRHASLSGLSSIEEVFRTMDLDGTGSIDIAEFSTGLASLGVTWKEAQIAKLFEQIDETSEGQISFQGFMRFMMQPTNQRKWKDLKRVINASISAPTVRQMLETDADVSVISRKLNDVERLIDVMEEAMIAQGEPDDEIFWRNKLSMHREFTRRYQGVVARAMGKENMQLQKRLSQLETQTTRITELEDALRSERSRPSTPNMMELNSPSIGSGGSEALQQRLKRENKELRRKLQAKDKELVQSRASSRAGSRNQSRAGSHRGSPRSRSPRPSVAEENLQDMVSRLRRENKQLRDERDQLREERDHLAIQKQKADDLASRAQAASGMDEDMLAQLSRMKRENKQLRATTREMRDEQIALRGVDNTLRKKLQALTRKLADVDQEMAMAIRSKDSVEGMIEELSDQLMVMTDRWQAAQAEIRRLEQQNRRQENLHNDEISQSRTQIARLKERLSKFDEREAALNRRITELEEKLRAQQQINAGLKAELRRTEDIHNENKLLKRRMGDKDDEIQRLLAELEELRRQLTAGNQSRQAMQRKMKLLEKVPENQGTFKKVERLYKIFRKLDKNSDEKLDYEEFAAGGRELGFGDTDEELQDAFHEINKRGDGQIDFDDFKGACLSIMKSGDPSENIDWKTMQRLLTKPPRQWTNEDVLKWLEAIGMPQYKADFRDGNVDGRMLLQLRPDDLRDMGVTKSFHMRKIMKELQDLKTRDDMLNNLQFENNRLRNDMDSIRDTAPNWDEVHRLQQRVRDMEGQLRTEKHAREGVMDEVRMIISKDRRFENMDEDVQDSITEVALLKGALQDKTNKLARLKDENDRLQGVEVDEFNPDAQTGNADNTVGRFLQKWYVIANHSTEYWVSPTNAEISARESLAQTATEVTNSALERTESKTWIFFDTFRERLVSQIHFRGTDEASDPRDVQLQTSVSASGPWSTIATKALERSEDRQRLRGFMAKGRFWRTVFLNNHGENGPDKPRYVMYEVQFWGPSDEEIESRNFVIE